MIARIFTIITFFAISQPVHAYIDPGTGSLIIQSILAAIAGIIVAAKYYWHRIITFFGQKQDGYDDSNNEGEKNSDTDS